MKKYNFIFSVHTLLITCLSLLSSYISLHFHFSLYTDFLVLGVIIAFPVSFTIREAFRRREKALEYISLFKATLQSLYYSFENSDLDPTKKREMSHILANTSSALILYLSDRSGDFLSVQQAAGRIHKFVRDNEQNLKKSFSAKILLFIFRTNECIAFLLATKRHHTPWAIRLIVLLGVYLFVIFYPATLLSRVGFHVSLWYVFVMTFAKSFILVCLYNIQNLLIDPFNQNGTDGVKLDDFQFTELVNSVPATEYEPIGFTEKEKQGHSVYQPVEVNPTEVAEQTSQILKGQK